jgi:hypothetical protein
MKLWTVWQDYFATGEGRTLMAHIGYAENAQEAIEGLGREFDPYFASGAEALERVHENEVTQALFAPAAFKRARELEGGATLALTARSHFNFA